MRYATLFILFLSFFFSCKVEQKPHFAYTNALITEKSPYLLQHAHNPVDWVAWENSKQKNNQNKLLIISIGYAACHWCHVMEKEIFSDTSIARLMNQNFVNIKIDREERPDIDNIYMNACQLSNEKGCGWPLNVIALPDGRPIWLGSYLPKEEWTATLHRFIKTQKSNPEKLEAYANYLKLGVEDNKLSIQVQQKSNFNKQDLSLFVEKIMQDIDIEDGGLIALPKFPTPALFDFLLNYEYHENNPAIKKAIFLTLDKMASGGIYDQLGGGFARYATDYEWKIPHFEKMLYDNAQLVSLYAHAYQVSKNKNYEKIVRETIHFLEANLQDKTGAFYASIDADTEEKEGQYYTWKKSEIDKILGKDAPVFCNYFSVTEKGNWENQENILYQTPAFKINQQTLIASKKALLNARNNRTAPNLDTKIITSWNALMLNAYLDAYKAFGDANFLKSAQNIANYLLKNQIKSGVLSRTVYQKTAFLDDYTYTIQAFVALYETTFDEKWLKNANSLADFVFKNFKQDTNGLFYFSTQNDLFTAPPVEITDGVLPSSNAVLTDVLHDLGVLLENSNYQSAAKKMALAMNQKVKFEEKTSPYFYWGNTFVKHQYPPFEVAIMGKEAQTKRQEMQRHFLPNALFLGSTKASSLPLLKDKYKKHKTMIYVCQNASCKLPTQQVNVAINQIK